MLEDCPGRGVAEARRRRRVPAVGARGHPRRPPHPPPDPPRETGQGSIL